ncbi:DUF255 domain-containing protein [Fulvivirga sp. 29W222]|uniref:DUF255 domain-containing protein n=1 Tax=Fulvivirga marina TaxID=2494733 RepID=A0A937KAX7_9BACT|nr:DUF255 domain-containing protein [Fulvivirga marina]MBL6445232.1 DUF255 domain-containing protein [Fulvivirga marina]
MRKVALIIFSLAFILVFFGGSAFKPEEQLKKAGGKSPVNWMSFEEAVEKSKNEKRKIFIDVYTDWCGWCKVMDKNTFSQPEIAKYLNENYYPVKLDAEQTEDIEFKGHTFKYVESGRRGYHQLAASLLNNKLSYPTVVFLDEDFNMIQPMPGYQKPDQFEKVINYIGGNHYKTTAWADWEKTFESSIY